MLDSNQRDWICNPAPDRSANRSPIPGGPRVASLAPMPSGHGACGRRPGRAGACRTARVRWGGHARGVPAAGPKLVGVEGFEPPTSWSQTRRATRLRYTPGIAAVPVGPHARGQPARRKDLAVSVMRVIGLPLWRPAASREKTACIKKRGERISPWRCQDERARVSAVVEDMAKCPGPVFGRGGCADGIFRRCSVRLSLACSQPVSEYCHSGASVPASLHGMTANAR